MKNRVVNKKNVYANANDEGAALFIDQEEDFDRVSHKFLRLTLGEIKLISRFPSPGGSFSGKIFK